MVSSSSSSSTINRGLYISPLTDSIGALTLSATYINILQNPINQTILFDFLIKNQINSLSFYNLYSIMNLNLMNELSSFIETARNYGVNEMIAVGAQESDFDLIKAYQEQYNGKFDGILTEVEFWNDSNITESYKSYLSLLKYIRSLNIQNNGIPLKVSTYLGWIHLDKSITEEKVALDIAQLVDRIYLHCFVKDISSSMDYCKSRIQSFINTQIKLEFCLMFSSEGEKFNARGTSFMGEYLSKNSLQTAEEIFKENYEKCFDSSKHNFNLIGYQYYEYVFLDLYLKEITLTNT